MKKVILSLSLWLLFSLSFADGYEIGDKAADFKLRSWTGKAPWFPWRITLMPKDLS